MKSTIEHPLFFFEHILNEDVIVNEIEKQIFYYDFISYKINFPIEIEFVEQNQNGEYVEGVYPLENILVPILRREFNNSKELLKDAFFSNSFERNKNFISYQFNTIQSLVNDKFDVLNKFPYFIYPLRGLVKFINDRLLTAEQNKYVLNDNNVSIVSDLNQDIIKSNLDLVHEIFGFMNGKNEKGEQILNKEDFELLISYILHLIDKDEIPQLNIKKIKPKLSNDLLRFSFWILHHELYTTKKVRPYFYDFIKLVFVNFSANEIKSIKSQFGTKSRVKRDNFIPEIIKKHL